jgi:hypothetical protein
MNDYVIDDGVIETMFPNSKFIICIELNNLNNILSSNKEKLIIKCEHNCYCYENNKRKSEYFIVNGNNGLHPSRLAGNNIITVKDCIQSLVDNNYDTECNHIFLEGFNLITESQIEPFFGS